MTELEKKPYCALKTVPLFALDSRHQKRQSPIFAADFAEASSDAFMNFVPGYRRMLLPISASWMSYALTREACSSRWRGTSST